MADRVRSVTFRPLTASEVDLVLMVTWLSDERVLEWYEGRDNPHDMAKVVEDYHPDAQAQDQVQPNLILLDGEPVGYVQFYPVLAAADYELESAEGTWGVDLFVGEPEYWGTGVGTEALRAVVRHLQEVEGAARIVIDPRVENPRAIRSYEKVGFRKVKVLEEHELHEGTKQDCWLMEIVAD